jgi:hypothetical protein
MRNNFRSLLIPAFLGFIFSCHSNNQTANSDADSTDKKSPVNILDAVPLYRNEVKADPVAEYSEKVNNELNDWHFTVKLYETKKTFYYLIKMQFEEVTAADTLKLPNLGSMPKPDIQKGNEKYSCVLGFFDAQNKFNEYKSVHVENGKDLKLTTLKHYYGAVYTK